MLLNRINRSVQNLDFGSLIILRFADDRPASRVTVFPVTAAFPDDIIVNVTSILLALCATFIIRVSETYFLVFLSLPSGSRLLPATRWW